ncbi:MAG: DNA helicase PcrA [Clostridia bacterium]|nr:DNA helicase PcrA [Clostridia bacterium]
MSDILEGLNKEQKEAVISTEGPLLIIAGAGSGKTRVLTHRVAYLIKEKGVAPWNLIAITFTNKAAKEMKERIEKLLGEDVAKDMWVGTFHSMCVRILRREIDKLGYDRNFLIFDTTDSKSVVKDCMKELGIDDKVFSDKYLIHEISKAKNEFIDPIAFEKKYSKDYKMEKVTSVYKLYQAKLKNDNAVDFDDIINNTIEIFKRYPEVLEHYQNKFQYVLVDEYQDTNKAQDLLISMLAEKSQNVCVVGDDQQSIYKFRGADISNILGFEKRFKNTKVVKLEQNYRSTKAILNVANEVIKNNTGNVEKNLWTENDDGEKPVVYQGNNEYDEANYVVSEIKRQKREEYYKYSDFTILYRTNAQSRVFEEILMREAIPYKVVGGQKFYERKEIKDIIAYLRVVSNPKDNVSLKRIINEPKRGIGKTSLDNIEKVATQNNMAMFNIIEDVDKYVQTRANDALKEFANFIKKMQKEATSIEELTQNILKESGYMKALEDEDTDEARSRIENLGEFLNVVIDFENENADNTLSDFLENLALVTDLDQVEENVDNVLLMTLHTAKGLEFPVVFMVGMEEGLFPSNKSIGEEAELEEERRLCYVGITRAQNMLYLTSARCRTVFGSTSYSMPSRFLTEIPKELYEGNIITSNTNRFDDDFYDDNRTWTYGTREKTYLTKEYEVANSFSDKPIRQTAKPFSFNTAEEFLKKKAATNVNDLNDYKVGQKVEHKKFGLGVITKIEPEDDDLKVEIEFEKAGMKRLMAKYANIKIVE